MLCYNHNLLIRDRDGDMLFYQLKQWQRLGYKGLLPDVAFTMSTMTPMLL